MNRSRKLIVFVHLLNDYSGSPLVLSHVIEALPDEEYKKVLYTSRSSAAGFLTGLPGVETRPFWYRWKANAWLRLLTFTLSQVLLFFQLLRWWRKDVVIYINTLLPFGAALAGRLMGKKVIYHLHETSMKPPALKAFLKGVANQTAGTAIYVSRYLEAAERLSKPSAVVIYNSLARAFTIQAAWERCPLANKKHTVLMLCSLKEYKGVNEFLSLARMLPQIVFELVLNADPEETGSWLSGQELPANCWVFPTQKDTHPFYRRASIVINLSHPDKWVETFGMTILEGMAYGLPVIVPPVGGVRELVDDGVNGFVGDYRDLKAVAQNILRLTTDQPLYESCSRQALIKARSFSAEAFADAVRAVVSGEASKRTEILQEQKELNKAV